jgi:beta-phosphoglucomutase-like phosphatase (HAD superfamily)
VPTRARAEDQPAILLAALSRVRAAGPGALAVFDLDSTLLDNRPRQAAILRVYGRAAGLPVLRAAAPEHFAGWDLARALASAGLRPAEVRRHVGPFHAFWEERFFTSRACRLDVPVPGAPAFVRAVRAAGARIAYVTGRPATMRPGTVAVLRAFGFPLPDEAEVSLLMKPGVALHDDAWKAVARDAVEARGTPVLVLDNEPTHVNAYARAWPRALTIHVDTDHSGRPVEVAPSIPSVADLRLDRAAPLADQSPAQRRASATSAGTTGARPPPPRMFTMGDAAARTTEPSGREGPRPQ